VTSPEWSFLKRRVSKITRATSNGPTTKYAGTGLVNKERKSIYYENELSVYAYSI
jgi:hypothetical protein